MPVTMVCPFCAHAYELADDYPHFTVQCPRCKAVYLFEPPDPKGGREPGRRDGDGPPAG